MNGREGSYNQKCLIERLWYFDGTESWIVTNSKILSLRPNMVFCLYYWTLQLKKEIFLYHEMLQDHLYLHCMKGSSDKHFVISSLRCTHHLKNLYFYYCVALQENFCHPIPCLGLETNFFVLKVNNMHFGSPSAPVKLLPTRRSRGTYTWF